MLNQLRRTESSPSWVVGGASTPRSVTLASETHAATARWTEHGIVVSVTTYPEVAVLFNRSKAKNWLPRVATLFIDLFLSSTLLGRLGYAVGVPGLIALNVWTAGATRGGLTGLVSMGLWVAVVSFVVRTRPWHAAEHQAAAVLDSDEPLTAEAISARSPVHERCGGRYVLPILLLSTVLMYALPGVNVWLSWFASWELVFQFERFVGVNKVPPFRFASALLQRYVTTCRPRDKHVQAALAAAKALVRTRAMP